MVEWTVTGSLMPRPEKKGAAIAFCNIKDQSVLRYRGLKAWDATGRSLPAKLTVLSGDPKIKRSRIAYVIDTTHASYPVMIDPLFTQVKKLLPEYSAADVLFGVSVSISGDTVVVGASRDDVNADGSGSAYIFYRDKGGPDNWGQVAKITASDGAIADYFGCSVSTNGDIVVVGAIYDDDNGTDSGSAYIFYRNQGGIDQWGQARKITASDGVAYDQFGYSVSISDNTIVVGATNGDGNGADSGSAYIFDRNQGGTDIWGQVKKIIASDGAAIDYFGRSVSISRDTVVVGAYGDDDNGSGSGSAYIFDRDQGGINTWGLVKKITASDGDDWDNFGWSVSISGDTVVVGAANDDDNGESSGSAYIFDRDQGGINTWGQVKKITASDGAIADYFGSSVSISEDTVIVSAQKDDDNGTDSGSAYVFYRDEGGIDYWGQVTKITASDGDADDWFGISVAINGETVVVGVPWDDDNGVDSGSAYAFNRDQGGNDYWGQVKKITASDGAMEDYFGYSVSTSGDTVVVGAYGDDDNGLISGSAYIFYRDQGGTDNWGQVRKITALDPAANAYFGYSVAISNDTVVVGAYGDDENGYMSGSAYIFYRNLGGSDNWGQVTKIIAAEGVVFEKFGWSVSISGDTVVVGAKDNNDYFSGSGSAYIFYRDQDGTDNWGQVTKIAASDPALSAFFGYSVAISNDTVVVGAYGDGSGYIFYRDQGGPDNWGQVTKITPLGGAGGHFGCSASISEDTVVVGAESTGSLLTGLAYIFYRDQGGPDNWGQVTEIAAEDGEFDDHFGHSVSINEDTVVVGAYGDDDNGTDSGSAYIFYRDLGGSDNWGQVTKITTSDAGEGDNFGHSVSIDGNTVAVGAEHDDINGTDSGSAYVFNYIVVMPGDIIINEIMKNPNAVADADGEWFELFNTTEFDIDINGWTIRDDGSDSHVINYGMPLIIPAGGYLVLGNNSDFDTNGGVYVDYDYEYDGSRWYIANGADEIILLDEGLAEIDRVEYDDGVTFPDPLGASMALKNPEYDNNIGTSWCTSTTLYGDGDFGTPRSPNDCAYVPCVADFESDGQVDDADLSIFAANFGRTDCSGDCDGDFIPIDNDVDGSDLAVFAVDYGRMDCLTP